LNPIDAVVGWLDPERGLKRVRARTGLRMATRAYEGAKMGRRTDGWKTTSTSGNSELGRDMVRLRDRARDLVRNYPYATQALANLESDLIGTGILARTKSPKAAALWSAWCKVCDAEGQLGFEALQGLAVRAMVEGGDALIRRRPRKSTDGLPVPLQLQAMEGDFLDHNKTGIVGGNLVIQGVEFDPIGGRAAYWLFDRHPGDAAAGLGRTSLNLQSKRIPASEIIHLFRPPRLGQVRGTPWFHAAITAARDLDEYEDAELMRKKIEACLAAFVTSQDDNAAPLGPESTDSASGKRIEAIEPGMIAYLKNGEDVKTTTPAQGGDYGGYSTSRLRKVAAGMSNTYEDMTGDLSNVNYSSYRAGHIRHWRMIEMVRWQTIVPLLCDRVWGWFAEAALIAGLLDERDLKEPVSWSPPRRESVDPDKDARAQVRAIRAGLLTWDDAVAENGCDPAEQIEAIKRTNGLFDDAGLVLDIDPRRVTMSGAAVNPSGNGENENVKAQD
jgi:lambda family phage portal protein